MSNNEMDASPHDSVLNQGSALVNDLDQIEEEEKKGRDEADFAQIVEQQDREKEREKERESKANKQKDMPRKHKTQLTKKSLKQVLKKDLFKNIAKSKNLIKYKTTDELNP